MKSVYDWICSCSERNSYVRATCQKCGKWNDLVDRKPKGGRGSKS